MFPAILLGVRTLHFSALASGVHRWFRARFIRTLELLFLLVFRRSSTNMMTANAEKEERKMTFSLDGLDKPTLIAADQSAIFEQSGGLVTAESS